MRSPNTRCPYCYYAPSADEQKAAATFYLIGFLIAAVIGCVLAANGVIKW
jgi:hypothetical protein